MYIGTTAVAINRGSGSLALTGITSIDGNAATSTSSTYTTVASATSGSYYLTYAASPSVSASLKIDNVNNLYYNASTQTLYSNNFNGSLTGNATTVTNGVYTSGSYSNPSWITGLAWSKISSTPTTLSGYGITDAVTTNTTQTIS